MHRVVYLPGVDGAFTAGEKVLALLPHCETLQLAYPARESRDLTAMADHVAAELQSRGWTGVTIIGESYGGAVAQVLARLRPETVSRLVMIASFTRRPGPVASRVVGPMLRRLPRPVVLFPMLGASRLLLTRGLAPDSRKRFHATLRQMPFSDIGWRIKALKAHDTRDSAASWSQPTMWVWGEEDKLVPWQTESRWVRKHRPKDAVVMIQGAGHMIPHQQREVLLKHICSFIGAH
jgi:pimeloyl-ACP methyl ester carboxylesterase